MFLAARRRDGACNGHPCPECDAFMTRAVSQNPAALRRVLRRAAPDMAVTPFAVVHAMRAWASNGAAKQTLFGMLLRRAPLTPGTIERFAMEAALAAHPLIVALLLETLPCTSDARLADAVLRTLVGRTWHPDTPRALCAAMCWVDRVRAVDCARDAPFADFARGVVPAPPKPPNAPCSWRLTSARRACEFVQSTRVAAAVLAAADALVGGSDGDGVIARELASALGTHW